MSDCLEKLRYTEKTDITLKLCLDKKDVIYLNAIARRYGKKLNQLMSDWIYQRIDGEILSNTVSLYEPEHDVITPILKALIFRNLEDNEKLTETKIKKAASIINCSEQDIYNLLQS